MNNCLEMSSVKGVGISEGRLPDTEQNGEYGSSGKRRIDAQPLAQICVGIQLARLGPPLKPNTWAVLERFWTA